MTRTLGRVKEKYQYNYNLFSELFLRPSTSIGCFLKSLKADVEYLKREFKRTGVVIKLHFINFALSGAFGYGSYPLAHAYRTAHESLTVD